MDNEMRHIRTPRVENGLLSGDDKILATYTPHEQRILIKMRHQLSGLGGLIGRDYTMPVHFNEGGQGWHWNFVDNYVKIDADDLLIARYNEKRKKRGQKEVTTDEHMEFLRFVMCHEGAHRRITVPPIEVLGEETWKQPGFSFMMNAIEDPRVNNFVAEGYPPFRSWMTTAYGIDIDFEQEAKTLAYKTASTTPRFMQAGFEYIKQWFRETQGLPSGGEHIDSNLPKEVRDVVQKTIEAARASWHKFPHRDEPHVYVDEDARWSYENNRDKVWSEFKKLVDLDMQDQKTREALSDMAQGDGQKGDGTPQDGDDGKKGGGQGGTPKELTDTLTPAEQAELEKALDEGSVTPGTGKPGKSIDPNKLSSGLKKKLEDYIAGLPEAERKKLEEAAKKALTEIEDALNKKMEGRGKADGKPTTQKTDLPPITPSSTQVDGVHTDMRRQMQETVPTRNAPSAKALRELGAAPDYLTGDLRDVFVHRKLEDAQIGFTSGKRFNVSERVRERVAGLRLFQTKSFEQREAPSDERDYAVLLLVDCSGSMRGTKAWEAFKSALLQAETLGNLGIPFALYGFQDRLLEFKSFDEDWNDTTRTKLEQMLGEIENTNPGGHNNCGDNDDGACLQEASRILEEQGARVQILVPMSDGVPVMDSGRKSRSQLDGELKAVTSRIEKEMGQILVSVGIESDAVKRYYTNCIPNVGARELSETLGEVLRKSIEQ